MRLHNQDENQNSLLSSRLTNRSNSQTAAKNDSIADIDIDRLRHSDGFESDTESVPVFDADGNTVNAGKHRKNRRKKRALSDIEVKHSEDDLSPLSDAALYDNELECEAEVTAKKSQKKSVILGKLKLLLQIALIILCGYIGFLTFGAIETRYVYDSNGNVIPEVLSVDDLYMLDEYTTLSSHYLRARILYENALRIDYKLSTATNSDYVTIAGEYTAMLEDVDKLITDISADLKTADAQYSPLYNQLVSWTSNDIAVYIQKMSDAISNNDSDSASDALLWRDTMYSDFSQLTENMYYLGVNTKGCTNLDIYNWSPESFSEQLV